MKQFIITEEEAKAVVQELMHSYAEIHNQKIISELIIRLEKELKVV